MVMPERRLENCQIMMSMSESPDLGPLAMGEQHYKEAVKEIARHLLADGATLAYGGDLRERGLTWLLFDMALTYNQAAAPESAKAKIVNYLACTAWEKEGAREEVELEIRRQYRGAAIPKCLPRPKDVQDPITGQPYVASEDNAAALTDMRQRIIAESHAHICLGGKVEGYSGRYPGILEEIALSLSKGRPVYLLGGFGGATADAAAVVFGSSPVDPNMRKLKEIYAPGYGAVIKAIEGLKTKAPNNGLNLEKNRELATAVDIQVLIPLLLRGLRETMHQQPAHGTVTARP
ncbi:MAG: hypothetical protein U0S49_00915 [Rhodospirillales bacterium]|nr:hypothetical protein [Rhodospirillales bacterium]